MWDLLDIRLLRCEIGDVNGLSRLKHAGSSCVRTGAKRSALAYFHECGRHIVKGDSAESIPLPEVQHAELGRADANRVREHGLEHRLQLAGRAGDHLQDLGAGRLLLERLGELARACLHLVEQAHVLDRDHRLVGEGLEQLDLLRTEGPRFGAATRVPATIPSRSSGTPTPACRPKTVVAWERVYSGSAMMSGIWTVRPAASARPKIDPRSGVGEVRSR